MERLRKSLSNKGIAAILFLCFAISSCGVARITPQIPDYLLMPNGKEQPGINSLTAFIFENNLTKWPIEKYLSEKFKSDNFNQREYWVTIDKDKYKIIIYDAAEFEKYFGSNNFSVINEVPDNTKNGDSRKFIAISMINSYNQDCLLDNSLFQNVAVKYLKNLKDEFYNQ